LHIFNKIDKSQISIVIKHLFTKKLDFKNNKQNIWFVLHNLIRFVSQTCFTNKTFLKWKLYKIQNRSMRTNRLKWSGKWYWFRKRSL